MATLRSRCGHYLLCILLEIHCHHKQWNCWQKSASADDQCLDSPWGCFTNRLWKILVNFKWCFACQLIASTARQDNFRDKLPVRISIDNVWHCFSTSNRAVQPMAACRQSPYHHKPAIAIVTSFSLWRLARAVSQSRCSLWRHVRCDVIRDPAVMRPVPADCTGFSLCHWCHTNHYGHMYVRMKERTDGHLTAFNI